MKATVDGLDSLDCGRALLTAHPALRRSTGRRVPITVGSRLHRMLRQSLWTARRQRDSMPEQTFYGTKLLRVFRRHETRGPSCGLHPGCPADSMDVIFRAMR